jgi:hypothetical protein
LLVDVVAEKDDSVIVKPSSGSLSKVCKRIGPINPSRASHRVQFADIQVSFCCFGLFFSTFAS